MPTATATPTTAADLPITPIWPGSELKIVLHTQDGVNPRSVRDAAKAVRDLELFVRELGFTPSQRVTQLKIVNNPGKWFSRDSASRDPDIEDMDDEIISAYMETLQSGGLATSFGAYVRENSIEIEFPTSRGHSVAEHYLTVVHELVHDRYQSGPMPTWFAEGMADFVTSLIWGHSLGLEYPRWEYCVKVDPEAVATSDVSLSQLSEIFSGHPLHDWAYTTGCEAVEYLASIIGIRGIFALAMMPEDEGTQRCGPFETRFHSFESALESLAGIPLDTFYSNFQAHRTRGLPSSKLPDGPITPLEPIELGSSECNPECVLHHPAHAITQREGSLIGILNGICDQLIAIDLLQSELHVALHEESLGLAQLLVTGVNWESSLIRDANNEGWPIGSGPGGQFSVGYVATALEEPAPDWLVDRIVRDLTGLVLQVREPSWMFLGMVEFLQRLATQPAASEGVYIHSPDSKTTVSALVLDLSSIKDESTWSEDSVVSSYGLEALELLVSWRGVQSLADYYSDDLLGEHWRVRFQVAFGMTPEQFYVHFARHREAGLPDLSIDLTGFDDEGE